MAVNWRKWQEAGEDYAKRSFVVCNSYQMYRDVQTKEGEVGGKSERRIVLLKDAVNF